MKKSLNIQINFTNRFLYTFISFIILLIIGIGVFAFGTSTPSTFGHSAGELDLSSGVSGNAIFNGDVGIGTSTPQVKLDVNGEVRIGNTGLACTSNIEGSKRYNSVDKIIEYCNGTSWRIFGTTALPLIEFTISSNTLNFNLYSALGNPEQPVDVILTINSGVIVGSESISQPAFTTGDLPAGSTVKIINNGRIQGKGGNGGAGAIGGTNAHAQRNPAGDGQAGGTALNLIKDVSIDNTLGQIWGGGGGGGGGGAGTCSGCYDDHGTGGGGGAGTVPGDGGITPAGGGTTWFYGNDGTSEEGGAALYQCWPVSSPSECAQASGGGAGGGPGIIGDNALTFGGIGGAAGIAVKTNGNAITWINQGDVRGPIN